MASDRQRNDKTFGLNKQTYMAICHVGSSWLHLWGCCRRLGGVTLLGSTSGGAVAKRLRGCPNERSTPSGSQARHLPQRGRQGPWLPRKSGGKAWPITNMRKCKKKLEFPFHPGDSNFFCFKSFAGPPGMAAPLDYGVFALPEPIRVDQTLAGSSSGSTFFFLQRKASTT